MRMIMKKRQTRTDPVPTDHERGAWAVELQAAVRELNLADARYRSPTSPEDSLEARREVAVQQERISALQAKLDGDPSEAEKAGERARQLALRRRSGDFADLLGPHDWTGISSFDDERTER